MVVRELAEVSFAYYLGELAVMSIVPAVGLILLIVGFRRQSRARRLAPGYFPPGPPPSGPPPNPTEPGTPPPPQYYPSPPPTPRPTRSSIVMIVVGSVLFGGGLLVILNGTADLAKQKHSAPRAPEVGDCIGAYNFRAHDGSPAAQDCAKPDSIFQVVSKGSATSTCPDGKTDDSDYAFLRDGSATLCFVLNFVQGRCYTASGSARAPLFAATDCDGAAPRFKVTSRIDDSKDSDSCPLGTKEISYKNPARLYCLQPLTN